MQMQVEYGLSAVGTSIRNDPVASLGDPFLLRKLARNCEKMPDELLVLRFQRGDRVDMLVWHDQDMGRRDGMGVPKSRHLVIAVKNGRFRFHGNDLAKNTRIRHF